MTTPDLDSVLAARLSELERDARSSAQVPDASLRPRVRRRRAVARGGVAAMVTVGIAVVSLGTATAVNRGLDGTIEPVAPPSLTSTMDLAPSPTSRTVLIVLTDAGVSSALNEEPSRLDTLALIHVPADGSRIEVVAIPRDVGVAAVAPECDDARAESSENWTPLSEVFEQAAIATDSLTAAMCVQRSLELETGVAFTGMIVTDFAGFISGADTLGGATVCLPASIEAPEAGLSLTAGEHHLDGVKLLALARARAGTGLADAPADSRSQRSAEVLAALVRATLARAAIESYGNFTNVLNTSLERADVTSSRHSEPVSGDTAWALRGLSAGDVVPFALPVDVDPESGIVFLAGGATDAFTRIQRDVPLAAVPWPGC